MFDPELLENPIAQAGLKLLTESGILRAQIDADRKRLQEGDADMEADELAFAIKRFRRKAGILETLHLAGEELRSKETEL